MYQNPRLGRKALIKPEGVGGNSILTVTSEFNIKQGIFFDMHSEAAIKIGHEILIRAASS